MGESIFLCKASETLASGEAVTSSARSLPPDILAEASKRLGWAGLIYAGTYLFAYFGPYLTMEHPLGEPFLRIESAAASISIAVGLGVFILAQRSQIDPQRLLDLGLIFEVVGAFGISMAQFWNPFPNLTAEAISEVYMGVPWECVWIIIFPLVAPNTPGKVLGASLAAASTAPLVVALAAAGGRLDPTLPLSVPILYFVFTTYLCAILAYVISLVVFKYGMRLKRAREIGSYELVEKLGEGGMGDVWSARHLMLARPAAIKLIKPELLGANEASRKNAVTRFEREARATAALRSTHTVDIYDFGVTDEGAFFYVMELLNGLSLDRLVKRFGPLSAARTVFLLRQACHSLGEAHERQMIHRDIKPANIFTCRLGPDYDFIKVLDFGLVKSIHGLEKDAQLTAEGVATGTPAFMAPELALEKSDVDGRADIYAVGCVAYWLLTGQHVFSAETPMAIIVEHVRAAPVPPSQRTEIDIPPPLEALILECLEKDPADRPHTTGELSERLAASVPDEGWSSVEARDWWQLHAPEKCAEVTATVEEDSPEGVIQVAGRE